MLYVSLHFLTVGYMALYVIEISHHEVLVWELWEALPM